MSQDKYKVDLRDAVWVLGMAGQGGFMVAVPVLVGLGIGMWLDSQFETLPCIAIVFTLIGGIIGPIVLYRWVRRSVAQRVERRMEENRDGEEKPE